MIRFRDVSKRYGDAVAVDGLSFDVPPGELLVLLGESGSGKTTALKMINRLIEPSAGQIEVQGEDVTQAPPHALRRRIGYVFQQLGLFPHMTVAENIGVTPTLLGWDGPRIAARVATLLKLVELPPQLAERRPHQLSGGQAQRVAVARALAAEPPVLLLDEPFGALDPLTRDRLQTSFSHIRRQLGLTAIFVTHDVVEAAALGDRVGVMKGGRLLQLGTLAELIHQPAHPYVAQLVSRPLEQARRISERLKGGQP